MKKHLLFAGCFACKENNTKTDLFYILHSFLLEKPAVYITANAASCIKKHTSLGTRKK